MTVVAAGATYSSTSDATNCALSYELRTVIPDAVYSGSFLTFSTSTGTIEVDTNMIGSEVVIVRVKAGLADAFTSDTASITITCACTGTYTVTEGSSINPTTLTQGTLTGYTLPTYTSSHATCPMTTYELSPDGVVVASVTNLQSPVSGVVKPIDNQVH